MRNTWTKILIYGFIITSSLFACTTLFAAEIIQLKNKLTTSNDVPLSFVLEKSTFDGSKTRVWGAVHNNTNETYNRLRVSFTVRDKSGKFLGRSSWSLEPDTVGPGQVGYINDKFIECEGRRPSTIETSVMRYR